MCVTHGYTVCVFQPSTKHFAINAFVKMTQGHTTLNQSDSDDELCILCKNINPPGSQEIIEWLQCDNCMGWIHNVCCKDNQSALDNEDDVFGCNICTDLVKP